MKNIYIYNEKKKWFKNLMGTVSQYNACIVTWWFWECSGFKVYCKSVQWMEKKNCIVLQCVARGLRFVSQYIAEYCDRGAWLLKELYCNTR